MGRLATAAGTGPRRLKLGAASAALVALSLGLSGCGGAGLTLARQACAHVNTSIRLYDEAEHTSDARAAAKDRTLATEQLESALPLAARATSADPQWNPLMTTLEEIGRNREGNLVAALRSQCSLADSRGEEAPVIAPSSPGPSGPAPSTLPGQ